MPSEEVDLPIRQIVYERSSRSIVTFNTQPAITTHSF